MNHLNPAVTAIVDSCQSGDAEDVRICFADLTQLEAIYVAAEVARRLAANYPGPKSLAAAVVDDCESVTGEAIKIKKLVGDGRMEAAVIELSNEDRSTAVAVVAIAEDMRPGSAAKISGQCRKVYDHADRIGV